jgi:hypothetical protein
MARDPKKIHAVVTFACSGTKSGHVSSAFNFLFGGGPDPTLADWNNVADMVQAFFNSVGSSGHSIGQYLSTAVNRGANLTETALYEVDVADPHHYLSSPVHVRPWSLGPVALGNGLPNECCGVLSYRTAYGTDPEHSGTTRPRASDRGRLYIGPITDAATALVTAPDGTRFPQLSTGFMTAMSEQAELLFTTGGTDTWIWSVWSRKEQLFKSVVDYANDQYIDTQRRRSIADPLQSWKPL